MTRFAAILAATTMLAGCSSGVSRFSEGIFTDDIFTGSTSNQRAIIGDARNQPYPGDAQPAGNAVVASAPVTPVASGNVQRNSLPPVNAPAVQAAVSPAPMDRTITGSTPPATATTQVAAAQGGKEGWSRAGGTEVTVRQGETIYNLSKRFGVPASEILEANAMKSASQLAAGQKVVIPTYVYSRKAGVSAPDANQNVADAKSSRGTRFDVPADKAPTPNPTPAQAVLPQPTKPKEQEAGERMTASNAAASSEGPSGNSYTVVAGDSLYAIAKKLGVSAADLKAANGLSDGHLQIGQTLRVPSAANTQVVSAPAKIDPVVTSSAPAAPAKKDTAPVTAYTPPQPTGSAIEKVAETAAVAPNATGIGRMRWPVRGRIIDGYGRTAAGKMNDGIDIGVPEGTPVKAAENGVVIYAGDGLKEFGNTVLVRHENGLVTVYGHAGELKVSRGDNVKRGQEIAVSGMTGSADRPKLHFEVRKDSAPVDPTGFLE